MEKSFGHRTVLLRVDYFWEQLNKLLPAFAQVGSLGNEVIDHFGLVDLDIVCSVYWWGAFGRVAKPADRETDWLLFFAQARDTDSAQTLVVLFDLEIYLCGLSPRWLLEWSWQRLSVPLVSARMFIILALRDRQRLFDLVLHWAVIITIGFILILWTVVYLVILN